MRFDANELEVIIMREIAATRMKREIVLAREVLRTSIATEEKVTTTFFIEMVLKSLLSSEVFTTSRTEGHSVQVEVHTKKEDP